MSMTNMAIPEVGLSSSIVHLKQLSIVISDLLRPWKYSFIFKSKQSLASPPLTGCWLLELG
jgi:hypothetical protein